LNLRRLGVAKPQAQGLRHMPSGCKYYDSSHGEDSDSESEAVTLDLRPDSESKPRADLPVPATPSRRPHGDKTRHWHVTAGDSDVAVSGSTSFIQVVNWTPDFSCFL
jgi:hypothetical protein